MPAKVKIDAFPNRSFFGLTCSAADTLTFAQIRFGVGLFQGVALVLHRIEWIPTAATLQLMSGLDDALVMALTNREDLTTLDAISQNVLIRKEASAFGGGTPGNVSLVEVPFISDFGSLPGQGLIVPANPLFIAMNSTSLGTAAVMDCVLYYTFKALSDSDYVELIQSLIPANI